MKYAIILCAALAGCSTVPSDPITPEQAQIIMQMNAQQQANNAAMWNNMQNNQVFQRQQTTPYVAPPVQRPLNCQTVRVFNTYQTRCY